jgi:two-component system alkaline phosphatase synthesis response regulator PhoP
VIRLAKEQGLVQLYYGDGKGKTTAVFGLAFRCAGWGRRVVVAQFLKSGAGGEGKAVERFPEITLLRTKGVNKFTFQMNDDEKAETAENCLSLFRQAVELARANEYDLIILDLMMPELDGLQACMEIRAFSTVPIIMLTARQSEMDKVAGLDAGADDYITKPFGVMELQARVNAVLRRLGRTDPVLRYRDLVIDTAGRTVTRDGQPIALTFKEFELLRLLVSRRGTVLTRDEILSSVWDYDFVGETRTVDMHIKALRQKLGEGYITTVRSVGYKME